MALRPKDNFDLQCLSATINELQLNSRTEKFRLKETPDNSKVLKNTGGRRRSFDLTTLIKVEKCELRKRRQSFPGHPVPSLPKETSSHRENIASQRYERLKKMYNIPIRKPKRKIRTSNNVEKNSFKKYEFQSSTTTDVINALKIVQKRTKTKDEGCITPVKRTFLPNNMSNKGLLQSECISSTGSLTNILNDELALQTLINTKQNSVRTVGIRIVPKKTKIILHDEIESKKLSKITWSKNLTEYYDEKLSKIPKGNVFKSIIAKTPLKEPNLIVTEDQPMIEVQSKILEILRFKSKTP